MAFNWKIHTMNFVRPNSGRGSFIHWVCKAIFYSTEAVAPSIGAGDTLYGRITRAVDQRAPSVVKLLQKWREQGNEATDSELKLIIIRLRKAKRWKHALQMSEWMDKEMDDYEFLPADMAVRLDLISQVHGLEKALRYFDGIPEHLRDFKVYGALLSSYARERRVEQAEAFMEKIRESGFKMIALYYNVMLKLYSQTRQFKKMDILMEEMILRGMVWDNYTYNIRLSAYGDASDMEGMEKLLIKMETDPVTSVDWNSYVSVANAYSKRFRVEKATTMLKKAEWLIRKEKEKHGYKILITLYTEIRNKKEVYRLWGLYKRTGHISSTCYFTMITSLLSFDDIVGAETILEECDYGNTYIDRRLQRVMVKAYCDEGMLEKAEQYLNRLLDMGKSPQSSLWDRLTYAYFVKKNTSKALETLTYAYFVKKNTSKALETLKKAIATGSDGWNPSFVILGSCIDYLKQKRDVDAAKVVLVSLNRHISNDAYDALVWYINNDTGYKAVDILKGVGRFRKPRKGKVVEDEKEFTIEHKF